MIEYEWVVYTDDEWQAGGTAEDFDTAKIEAMRYAREYASESKEKEIIVEIRRTELVLSCTVAVDEE